MGQVKLIDCKKLEEENRELKYVLSKLSHEMGNALTLLGASIYYVEINIANKKVECDISDLKNDYTYICNLFKELREYNLAESIVKKEITIEEVVRTIESSFDKMRKEEDVLLFISKQKNILNRKIYGDLVMLQQAFINLLKNSIEAVEGNESSKGKKIDVKILVEKIDEQLLFDIDTGEATEMMHIEVADNGKGISETHMDKIFKPMFTYGKKDGTGLGLSIVKKIVDKHKGKIKAVSVLGTGTALHIYIPLSN